MHDQVLISELAVQPSQTISLETLILETMASQPPSTKQDIIASLFSKRAVEDGNLEESYISHVKIFEDDGEGGGVKARYLTLSGASLSASFSPLAPACPLHLYGYLSAGEADGCPFVLGWVTAARSGRCFVHKAKRNSNGTFSKGKTWNLEDLRVLEVVDVRNSLSELLRALLCP